MHRVSDGCRSSGPSPKGKAWDGMDRLSKHLKPDGEIALGLGLVGLLTAYALLIVVGVLLLA